MGVTWPVEWLLTQITFRPGSRLTPVAPADYYSKFMTNPVNTKDGTWDIAPVGWTPDWAGGSARSVFQPRMSR